MKNYFSLLLLCTSCFSSELPQGACLSSQKWQQCENFIRNEASAFLSQGSTSIPPGPSHPWEIEQDPVTHALYIHLKGEEGSFLGAGLFKHVTQSVLYGKRPELVARCEGGESLEKEAKILAKLRGARGIVHLKSFIHHQCKDSDLILEYFNAGSLKDIETEKLKIEEKELLPVMRDLICGLKALHSAGYAHRDLHRRNILFNRSRGVLHAALTDFGLALRMRKNSTATLSAQDSLCAPEVLVKKLQYIDRKKAEAYSLGVLLYYCIFHKMPSWSNVIVQHDLNTFSRPQKTTMYQEILACYKKTISIMQHMKGIPKDAALLTLRLLNPDPAKRIYLDKACKKIDAVAKKWHLRQKHQKSTPR